MAEWSGMAGAKDDLEWRSPEEASRLCDEAFRRLLKMPPKPHSEMKLGKPRGQNARRFTENADEQSSSDRSDGG